ncbi:nuclear factor 7, ovary-like [Eucyclogobius newberryi]|uniref:nuclear factor 7, ovary-like n=1 Tax=Eucyclogobius newberryi TaxID=166745 RepID=UPI003B5C289C
MANTDENERLQLAQLLTCPVCQDIFKDPRQLPCGHSFCLTCVQRMVTSGVPFRCPDCRADFGLVVEIQNNYTLSGIAEEYRSKGNEKEEKNVYCDCCPDNSTLAVKTCLKCEVSLCQTHVKSHLELPVYTGHPLVEPLSDLPERKCPQHDDQVLRYYCRITRKYICNLCSLKTKQNDLATQTCNVMKRQLTEYMNGQLKVLQEKLSESTSSVNSLQEEIHRDRKRMNSLDSCFNSVTVVLLCLWFIVLYYAYNYSLENHKLTDKWEKQETHVQKMYSTIAELKLDQDYSCRWQAPVQSHDEENLMLDLDSVSPYLKVSEDLQTVQRVKAKVEYPNSRHRFMAVPQVLSSQCFTSGTHVWEVEADGSWEIAVAFKSIQRKIKETSSFGNNAKSWSLAHTDKGKLYVLHNKEKTALVESLKTNRLIVTVNFVRGSIAFSTGEGKVTKLHEFSVDLTEPVCLGFGLYRAELSSSASILKAFRVRETPVS